MKIYVGNVTLDTSLKLTKEEAEKLGQYLIPYKEFKMTIFDCIVKIGSLTVDACHKDFNLFSFLKNLYMYSDTLVTLIRKFLASESLLNVDLYSVTKYREEIGELIYSIKPRDPLSFSSSEKCECVKTYGGFIFINKEKEIKAIVYSYNGFVLYIPENLPGNYSCFVKEIGDALESFGFKLNVIGNKINYFSENGKATIYQSSQPSIIPLEYVFPFLYKLVNDERFRNEFIEIAEKIVEIDKKRQAIESSYYSTKDKIEAIIYRSAGLYYPME